jgi:hypothetical protein
MGDPETMSMATTQVIFEMKRGARLFQGCFGFWLERKGQRPVDVNLHSSRSLQRRKLIERMPDDPHMYGTEWTLTKEGVSKP